MFSFFFLDTRSSYIDVHSRIFQQPVSEKNRVHPMLVRRHAIKSDTTYDEYNKEGGEEGGGKDEVPAPRAIKYQSLSLFAIDLGPSADPGKQ